MSAPENIIGNCEICGRPMVDGPTVNVHHLVPKTYKGKETITIHIVCHTKIHSVFSEKELATVYNTAEKLREHPEMVKFIKWVSKKDPEFKTRNKTTNSKPRRRR